jgi:hypothetical protein
MDAAAAHPYTFLYMFIVMVPVCLVRVGRATAVQTTVVKIQHYIHVWMIMYLVVQLALTALTTAIALFLLYDSTGQQRIHDLPVPASFLPLAAAVIGVFGFDILISKLIVGFGETKLDFSKTLQDLLDQAVAATLKKAA